MAPFFDHSMRPVWPAPKQVQSLMTDRHGGVSSAPWDSMNLGDHVGDLPQSLQINRQRLQDNMGTRPVFLKQVHGVDAVLLDASSRDGTVADACIAVGTGVACTIMVADCLPVLMCDSAGRWVAAAHAGWRGLAGVEGAGVLESLLRASSLRDTAPDDVLVWLGPCIGPKAFEVGPEVRAAFCVQDPAAAAFFKPSSDEKWLADLAGLAKLRLLRQGVHRVFGNDSQSDWCTFTQASKFFSHRRDSRVLGQTGRMAACIWLTQ
ncbi:peptidoglycan editing factor PgeF [Limnohabitans sp.]|uniref:peptidoglycan editing factor PgeF n=1 Tax=Limnohabitans sp. TaxID=1907725 RepID=UPI0037BF10C8